MYQSYSAHKETTLSRSVHAWYVIRFTAFISVLVGMLFVGSAVLIISPVRNWSVTYFWATLLLYILLIPFGIIIGFVINRYIIVAISEPRQKRLQLSTITRISRKIRTPFVVIIILVPVSFFLLFIFWISNDFPTQIIMVNKLKAIHSAQKAFYSKNKRYGKFNELIDRGFLKYSYSGFGFRDFDFRDFPNNENHWFCIIDNYDLIFGPSLRFYIDETGISRQVGKGDNPKLWKALNR